MPIYANSDQLYASLKLLFTRIKDQGPEATRTILTSRLVIRIRCKAPEAEVTINGRQHPVDIRFGISSLRPDLDVDLSADALHYILLGELRLRKALASGQMTVRGPLLKTYVLEDVFHRGQALYPSILREQRLDGYSGI